MSPLSGHSLPKTKSGGSWRGLQLLVFMLLLNVVSLAQAADKFCADSPYNGVIDGDVLGAAPTQITINDTCTFQNWPQSKPLGTNINFQTNDPSIYLIVFDNVWYTGNLACANIPHKLWVVNSPEGAFSGTCQDIMIPAETIDKVSPSPYAAIGVPFTYTLTLPSMNYPAGDPSPNKLGNVTLTDDLNATGASLTLVGEPVVTWKDDGSPVTHTLTKSDPVKGGLLTFELPTIPAGRQIEIKITVVADDTNAEGTVFTNTAKWDFSRSIDLDENGFIEDGTADLDGDGIFEEEFFDPLPGEWGVSTPMTIAGPDLVVNKTSSEAALSPPPAEATFTIDVQNIAPVAAYQVTILDRLPDLPDTGMCDDPSATVTARIVAADGATLVRNLAPSTDYTLTYVGPTSCELTFAMTPTGGAIEPNEHLILTYQAGLDADTNLATADGAALSNIAGATQWFSGEGSYPRTTYNRTVSTDPAVAAASVDHEDSATVYAALAGYYFQKIVSNQTSLVSPTTTAAPGDELRYKLRLFNVTEVIDGITITDTLDPAKFDLTTFQMVTDLSAIGATFSFDSTTGSLTVTGNGAPLSVAPPGELTIEFDITLKSTLVNGNTVDNQATLTAASGITAPSDDPYVNGIAAPDEPADITTVLIQTPGPLSKQNGQESATIGEYFTYRITVPAVATAAPLYDVRILDTLPTDVDLRFVSAQVVSGGNWTLSNTGTGSSLIIEDTITGIDILSGQAVIEITVELLNTDRNDTALAFNNSASYTYNRANGNDGTQTPGDGGSTDDMAVVEPAVTAATKTVRNVTAGKNATDPAAVGDVLEYVITIPNSGDATAFDTNVVDSLPANVTLVSGSATATIGGVAVAGFVADPTVLASGALAWGDQNGDDSLDIPAGGSLVLTYQVTVASVAGVPITNSAYVDWTSLDGVSAGERTGEGCPTTTAPNDYCYGPVTVAQDTVDPTTIIKSVDVDSWNSGLSTGTDAIVRIGDTVDYRLAVTLREGQLQNVVITDTLPAGLVFDSVVSINGDTTAPFSATAPFAYNDFTAPTVSGSTVTWSLGDVTNAVDNNATNDTLVIIYRARVVENILAHEPSTALDNSVSLAYVGSDDTTMVAPTQLVSSARITVQQPVITAISKIDTAAGRTGTGTSADPYQVDIITDVMNFQLQACNTTGLAPAYGVAITDQLAPELDEASLGTPVVTINGNAATAGVDYTYTGPAARGGTLSLALLTPIDPGQCVTVSYDIGFHADIGPGQTWNNTAAVDQYWSLPPADAQQYGVTTPIPAASVYMTNAAIIVPPAKVLSSPASGEATIGEEVEYQITVPGTTTNAALYNVVVTDTLHPSLAYVDATATLNGSPLTLNDTTAGNDVRLGIAQIPAGQQAVITLRTRVANNADANAGTSFLNTASYTYAASAAEPSTLPGGAGTTSTALLLVEPVLVINKGVVNVTHPGISPTAGDVLRYTLTFPASSGTNYSDAFDLGIVDDLSLGLAYRAGTATVNGTGNTIADPLITGDGVSTAQRLTWDAATADIDVPAGATVTVTYEVQVLDGVAANQDLVNRAAVHWTSLDGASADERTGVGCPTITPPNDYCAGPVEAALTTPDSTSLAKTRLTDTYGAGDANVRVGDLVEYELRIVLQEGQHQDLVLTDVLPRGLAFEGTVSVNGDTAPPYDQVAPFQHDPLAAASVSGDPLSGPTTITWTLGDILNVADGNTANDEFVIIYRARVVNEVHPQVDSITLTNDARLEYTTGTGAALRTASESITVLQPTLTVAKTAAPAGGDSIINAGEVITYTVDIHNSGTAPAYDVVLRDTLSVGLRHGTATITAVSISLLSGPALPNLAPAYDAGTGIATWDFDASIYAIPAGDTLRLVYQVQADADVGAGMTLTNQAQVQLYYSFDDEAVPSLGGVNGVREVYGPSNIATTSVTTPTPGALQKENPTVTNVAIGQPFTYRITVPATPVATALRDVRIVDDLSATGADLSFVSAAKVSGSQPWTPVNTGTATNLVIEDPTAGIDIPAGEQVVIDITVVLTDAPTNVAGLQFSNTASYTYNQVDNDSATRLPGAGASTGDLTIVGPDALTLEKSGPSQMRPGVPGTFTLNVHNTGTGTAWGVTLTDLLPNPTPGGMCDAAPTNVTAQLYQADGVTPVGSPLVAGTDFAVSFTGAPSCTFTLTMQSAAGAVPANHRLIITYQASLDADNVNGASLTNVAGATRWFSADPASGISHSYTRTLTDGTVGTLDHQDAHTVVIEAPVLVFHKTVANVTTGQNPGTNASPGDVLRYTLRLENISPVPAASFSLVDELDRLNQPPVFEAGSLRLITVPAGTDASSATGGDNGTGLVDIRNLTLAASDGAAGGPDELLVVYEVTLRSSIVNGTRVLNQAQAIGAGQTAVNSDDPNINGADDPNVPGGEDPTQIAVASAPVFQVQKTSEDMTGDAATLMPGDTLRYTITVKNVGNEDAVDVVLQDTIPADTTYVANSTRLNGSPVPDAGGNSPLQAGMSINASENPTPGLMRANADPAANNIATIVFNVVVNVDAVDGTVISNQGVVNGSGASGTAFSAKPSDDPATPVVNDPTLDTVSRPNGVIYDSVTRRPIAGATVRLLRASDGGRVPESCFSDPAQQDQVTTASGYYKFDLTNFNATDCPEEGNYVIAVTAAPSAYNTTTPSLIIPSSSDSSTFYSVPSCPNDAVPSSTGRCEAQASSTMPTGTAATTYYLHLTLGSNVVDNTAASPTTSDVNNQIFNNHIPVDPKIDSAVAISKKSSLINVTRSQLVPYTITVKNTMGGTLQDQVIVDTLPPGFKYVANSSRLDGKAIEPLITGNGRQLRWENLALVYNETHTIKLLLIVGSGVSEGEYINQAQATSLATGGTSSGIATATVRVVPDPTFDCTDIIGKVYDDTNANGYQDHGEPGLSGARVVSARGLIARTDQHGRFHITCAAVPNEDRGSNFILKLDDRSLPSGYRLTTENPRVERLTRGKMAKFNFGATIHRVVRLDVADGVFEENSTEMRPQWISRIGLLLEELRKSPAVLRLSYLADVEDEGLVTARVDALKQDISRRWSQLNCCYVLKIETEIFWRRGGPPQRRGND